MASSSASEPRGFRQERFRLPSGGTDILLVRHGESQPAIEGRPFPLVDGHGDPALAPEGTAQADRIAKRLAHERIDAIYVTSLRRTSQTAAPLVALTGLVPVEEPDLREVFLGEWEGGLLRKMVAEGHPTALRIRAEERWDVIPGAEPAELLEQRVRSAVTRIASAHPDQRVVVFSHGGVIAQVMAIAAGSRPFAFGGADNGSISQVVVTAERWIVRRFNDTAHLDSELSTTAEPLT
jgi:probable phosphoglycerate mutase